MEAGDRETAVEITQAAIDESIAALDILDPMTDAMGVIGERFSRQQIELPERSLRAQVFLLVGRVPELGQQGLPVDAHSWPGAIVRGVVRDEHRSSHRAHGAEPRMLVLRQHRPLSQFVEVECLAIERTAATGTTPSRRSSHSAVLRSANLRARSESSSAR